MTRKQAIEKAKSMITLEGTNIVTNGKFMTPVPDGYDTEEYLRNHRAITAFELMFGIDTYAHVDFRLELWSTGSMEKVLDLMIKRVEGK